MPKPAGEAAPNELLIYERRKRHWIREDVVEKIRKLDNTAGVDANTVGRWERGITEPTAHHLRLLTTLYERSIEELGYVSEDRIPFWNVESFSLHNPFFIGREDILKKLHAIPALRDEHRKKYPLKLPLQQLPQALIGLGGIGKTQIALQYAYRYMHDYHTIVWLRADSLQTLRSDFAAIATLLNLPEKQLPDQEQIIVAVKQWLRSMTRWLLIFDDVETPETIYSFLPSPCYGHILITTRSQSFVPEIGAQSVEVDEMTQEEAMDFLLQRARIIERAGSHTSALQTDRTLARTITETLGRLPLALDQAGAYIQRTQCGLSGYYDAYQKNLALTSFNTDNTLMPKNCCSEGWRYANNSSDRSTLKLLTASATWDSFITINIGITRQSPSISEHWRSMSNYLDQPILHSPIYFTI